MSWLQILSLLVLFVISFIWLVMNWCASTSALGCVICGDAAFSASGDGLLSGDESPPRRCESNTSSAICRPILLASTCVLISLCISRPPAAEMRYSVISNIPELAIKVTNEWTADLFHIQVIHSILDPEDG